MVQDLGIHFVRGCYHTVISLFFFEGKRARTRTGEREQATRKGTREGAGAGTGAAPEGARTGKGTRARQGAPAAERGVGTRARTSEER